MKIFGMLANRNQIEVKRKDTQNINKNERRRNLHNAYMCDQGLFPIWQIDTRLNNRGYRDELRNKMDHVISYSNVNDPIIRFKLMSINNLGKKKWNETSLVETKKDYLKSWKKKGMKWS